MTVVLGRQQIGQIRGDLQAFPNGPEVCGNYDFEGTGNDLSGLGNNLTRHAAGYEAWAWHGSKRGTILDTLSWWSVSTAAAPELDIQGALTIELLYRQGPIRQRAPGSIELIDWGMLVGCRNATPDATGSAGAYQVLAGFSTSFGDLSYYHTAAGPAVVTPTAIRALPDPGGIHSLGVARSADGLTLDILIDGEHVATRSLSAPPGDLGPDTFYVGSAPVSGGHIPIGGTVFALHIAAARYSNSLIRSRARRALGLA